MIDGDAVGRVIVEIMQANAQKLGKIIPVDGKAIRSLLVKGKTITADAMHCQKETCSKIIQKGGEYVFGLKGNQGRSRKIT